MDDSKTDADGIQELIKFLKSRESYPHAPETVKHIQTHISNVFIAPPFVYKTKKRVDFGFLDYSTLEKRKYYCDQEVELNRRLCSEIYLGVEAVVSDGTLLKLVPRKELSNKHHVVDYAVKMKLLDETWFLHSYIERDELSHEQLDRVAVKLANFYDSQSPDASVAQYGDIEKIKFNTDENFEQTEQFIDDIIRREAFKAIRYFTNSYLKQNERLFQKRVSENRIVDGHGDLHLEHIHVSPGGVCIYDCIEFSERLRYGDQAVDLAFFAMDLDHNEKWKESRYFIEQMSEKLDDPELSTIIDFYKCYRAYVKGKVKSMKSREEEVEKSDRNEARQIAGIYFDLSLRYALIGSKPLVLVCMGRIATGKSTIAEHLGKTLNADIFSSDRIRKELAGLPLHERPPEDVRKEIYSPEISEKTYSKMTERAIESIQNGQSVILDATFSLSNGRQNLVSQLEEIGAEYLFIEAVASDETIKSRLKKRDENQTISDARLEDFEMLTGRYDAPNEIESDKIIKVDTGKELSETIAELYEKLICLQMVNQDIF